MNTIDLYKEMANPEEKIIQKYKASEKIRTSLVILLPKLLIIAFLGIAIFILSFFCRVLYFSPEGTSLVIKIIFLGLPLSILLTAFRRFFPRLDYGKRPVFSRWIDPVVDIILNAIIICSFLLLLNLVFVDYTI
jgi:hypothetical protein